MSPNIDNLGRPILLKIISVDFEVRWINKEMEDGARRYGWCDFTSQTIFVSGDQKPMKQANTFLHEVVHAINWEMGIEDGAKEEFITSQMASGLCAFWRDNPQAIRWMNEILLNQNL